MTDEKMIAIIKGYYKNCKRFLFEHEYGISTFTRDQIQRYDRSVKVLEKIPNFMDDIDRLIIQNEVLKDKKGRWYEDYMSVSTYYRRRKKAYSNYINLLDK